MPIWDDIAKDQFADIWVQATQPGERDRLERAYHRVNRKLDSDPMFVGESRGGNRRLWFTRPLAVLYELIPGGGARVLRVLRPSGTGPDDDDD